MNEYGAIVIGAGNGGMMAACALAKDGIDTLVIEKHNVPGGAASSFRRGRFEFETALHHLPGLGTKEKPGILRNLFEEIGIADQIEWLELENISRIIIPGELNLPFPANREKLVDVLKKAFPDEAAGIDKYFEVIYGCWEDYIKLFRYNFNAVDAKAVMDAEATPEKYPYFYKYAYMPMPEFFASCLKNPLLILALGSTCNYSGPVAECTVIDIAIWTYMYIEDKPFHISGRSHMLSTVIMEKYRQFGGKIKYNTKVTRIITEGGRAVGVITAQGEEIRAKQVIANISPMLVYKTMMDAAAVPPEALVSYKGYVPHAATFMVYVGLDCEPEEIGLTDTNNFIIVPNKRPIIVTCPDIVDPEIKGSGMATATITSWDTADTWINIPPEQYFEKKCEMAEKFVAIADIAYPGFRSHIEELEIATAVTNARYMGSPGGSIGGFKQLHKDYFLEPINHQHIPGLTFVGQWENNPGGYHPTMLHGWAVGHDISKKIQ